MKANQLTFLMLAAFSLPTSGTVSAQPNTA